MAGAILGAIVAVVILLISLLVSVVKYIFSGANEFVAMKGGTFVVLIILSIIIGGLIGYAYGFYMTKNEVIEENIKRWLKKNNR